MKGCLKDWGRAERETKPVTWHSPSDLRVALSSSQASVTVGGVRRKSSWVTCQPQSDPRVALSFSHAPVTTYLEARRLGCFFLALSALDMDGRLCIPQSSLQRVGL